MFPCIVERNCATLFLLPSLGASEDANFWGTPAMNTSGGSSSLICHWFKPMISARTTAFRLSRFSPSTFEQRSCSCAAKATYACACAYRIFWSRGERSLISIMLVLRRLLLLLLGQPNAFLVEQFLPDHLPNVHANVVSKLRSLF